MDSSATHIKQCMPFQGRAGQAIGAFLGAVALLIYTVIWSFSPSDHRTQRIFALDLAKIALSTSFAWLVNLGWAHVSTHFVFHSDHVLQGVAWFAAVLVMDTIVGVPLGVWMGQRFTKWCQRYVRECDRSRCSDEDSEVEQGLLYAFALRNAAYGRYWPEPETKLAVVASREELVASFHNDSSGSMAVEMVSPKPRWDWWLAQVTSWSVCVILSRVLSGTLMLVLAMVLGQHDPVLTFAEVVHRWDVSCAIKQVAIVGVFRVALDVLQIGIIDIFNHFDLWRAVYDEID